MEKKLDPENMFKAIWEFPENLINALELGNSIKLKNNYNNINNIVIAGMGGSAIGGDVLSVLEANNLNIPVVVCRGYSLPKWVDNSTLVICSSYSGNTEETLAALDDAIRKKAQICGITTGGLIGDKIKELGYDLVMIPSGLQPRAALAFSFVPMTKLIEKIGLINPGINIWLHDTAEKLKKKRELYSIEETQNSVYGLAKKIYKKIPILYADNSTLSVVALRMKGQICENAKMLAYHNDLPELNHNEIVGWENNSGITKDFFVLWLKDEQDNNRVKLRQEITSTILSEKKIDQAIISIEGDTFEYRFLNMINYGDWLSYWCAILHNTDPSPVVKIARLKNELSAKS
jgi:glucose/mannose-6-phosphate isomerase